MISNSRNSDIELYKKRHRNLIKDQAKAIKSNFPHKYSVEAGLVKQRDLEAENRLKWMEFKKKIDINESTVQLHGSIRSSSETPSSLVGLKEIQERAKQVLKNLESLADEVPRRRSPKFSDSPVNIPVLVPQSIYRKAQRLPPPTIQKVTSTGESFPIHLLTDSSKIYDPMLKVYAKLDLAEAGVMKKHEVLSQVTQDIQSQFKHQRSSSLPPPPEPSATFLHDMYGRHCPTPRGKAEYYSFRDLGFDHVVSKSPRSWVKERTDQYCDQIKGRFVPRVDEKKQLEMILLREKMVKITPVPVKRIKLLKLR